MIEGWNVNIDRRLLDKDSELTEKALKMLEEQLREIVRVVPSQAVERLKRVPLWFSPEYPGFGPRAEYHPGAGWLKDNGRDPIMVRGIEFTNIRIFAQECRRMPNFALHELAHSYHHQVLENGFENAQVKEAFDRAKAAGIYESVEQRFGDGRSRKTKAYAMSTPQEYFAESTEAFFSRNDFFPFERAEIEAHDPAMFKLLKQLWGTGE
ncbi:MAG: hypothetical protein U0892_03830 [Pirellulales bacterium]